MKKPKTVCALLLCCLPVWAISTLAVYTMRYLFNLWHSPPTTLTWWGAAAETFPGFLALFLFVIWITYWKQSKRNRQNTKPEHSAL